MGHCRAWPKNDLNKVSGKALHEGTIGEIKVAYSDIGDAFNCNKGEHLGNCDYQTFLPTNIQLRFVRAPPLVGESDGGLLPT
jgi:hypothetical protein